MNIPIEAVEVGRAEIERVTKGGLLGAAADEMARLVLESSASLIAAQALEDAAEELKGKRLLNKPFHEYYPEWLRRKADTYRSKP